MSTQTTVAMVTHTKDPDPYESGCPVTDQWLDCLKQLPATAEIVWIKNKEWSVWGKGFYREGAWIFLDDYESLRNPTHWMPLRRPI